MTVQEGGTAMIVRNKSGRVSGKMTDKKGVSRLVFILIVALCVLLIVASVPLIMYYRSQSAKIGCVTALDTASRQIADKFLIDGFHDAKEVKNWVTLVMNGWDDLCPGGGNVYVVYDKDADMPWRLVCGLHGEDRKECCRLNAAHVLDLVREEIKKAADEGSVPESVEVRLNGEKLVAKLTEEETGLVRGTYSTTGYNGTVAFYGITGIGKIGASSEAGEGEICYFSFADPDNCANWKYRDGWTGSAWKR